MSKLQESLSSAFLHMHAMPLPDSIFRTLIEVTDNLRNDSLVTPREPVDIFYYGAASWSQSVRYNVRKSSIIEYYGH